MTRSRLNAFFPPCDVSREKAGVEFARTFPRLLTLALLVANSLDAHALQSPPDLHAGARVVAGNVAIGGATAALRAFVGRRSVARALWMGSVGGAVHAGGKLLIARSHHSGPIAGVLTGSVGASIVVAAGAGSGILGDFFVPVGPVQLHFNRGAKANFHVTISLYESLLVAGGLVRRDVGVDWSKTARAGTLVFTTRQPELTMGGRRYNGLAIGSVVIVGRSAVDPSRTLRHELIHVQQYVFVREAWGRPLEHRLRHQFDPSGRAPSWLELDITEPALSAAEVLLFGTRGPLWRLRESETRQLVPVPPNVAGAPVVQTRVFHP